MSVYFSKYCVNGYRDSVPGGDPQMRDRLLAAIKELAVLGPGQLQSSQTSLLKTSTQGRSLDSSRATGSPEYPKVHRSHSSSPQASRLKQSNPHGVLKEKLKRSVTLKLEKGIIKIYANILHPDVQFKTLSITFHTTSKELVSSILKKYNAQDKDPNLYYVAMETGIKHKDSGLPISKMIVLEDDARPLELQACQPQGEAKFHLRIKSGGVVRVRISTLCPESSYKTVYIARNTTSRQLIELLVNGSGTEENPDDFTLREASSDLDVDRILGDNEYPLEIQTKWKPNEGRVFFLTRLKKKPDSNPAVQNAPETTSEELRNEIARQNQTIDTMNETIQRLQLKQDIKTENSQHIYTANYSASDQNDYDKIDDMNQDTSISKRVNKRIRFNDSEETNNRQQSASAYGVDLHKPRLEKQNDSISKRPSQSQINKLRRSFDRYRKKSYDDSDLELMRKTNVDNAESKNVECSSQIERFRHNFLKYYNIRNGNKLHKPISRSWSTSDAEYYDIAKNLASVADVLDKPQKSLLEPNNYSNNRELETVLSRNSSFNSLCDREIRRVFENAQIQKQDPESNKTLYDVIKEKELVAVTMKREPGKELGLELAHVTQTGSPIDDPCEVMYVFHKSDGNTSIVGSPTSILSEDDNQVIDYENEVDDVFADSPSELSQDSHICFGSQSDDSSQSNSPKPTLDDTVAGDAKKETGEPGSPGSCCTLAEWREGNGPKPHHGVRIVGVTAGSIAENAKTLEKR